MERITPTCPCGADRFTTVHTFLAPPEGEVRFAGAPADRYRRELRQCACCGHYISVFAMAADFYQGAYVDATYGDAAGVRRTFDKIMALPPERSDNAGRVDRILAFAAQHFGDTGPRTVLDVGSGLCVFLARMKAAGWRGTAIDPDERAVRHARETVGVEARCGSLPADGLPRHDVVTFNKVLEHVEDPIALLAHARVIVAGGTPVGGGAGHGFVYVELPDGEVAAREVGFTRQEFFVEHFHAFSAASIAILGERAGFEARAIERLREPSGKFTLRAFLTPRK